MAVFAGIIKLGNGALNQEYKKQLEKRFNSIVKNGETINFNFGSIFIPNSNGLESLSVSNTFLNGDAHFNTSTIVGKSDIQVVSSQHSEHELFDLLSTATGVFSGFHSYKDNCFLFTDKLGIRPIYYYQSDTHFIFSSLFNVISDLSFLKLTPDLKGVSEQLAFGFALKDRTIFQEIKRLDYGCCLVIKGQKVTLKNYWKWRSLDQLKLGNNSVINTQKIYKLFKQAVKKRLSGGPAEFAFLSGGLDSRVVCAAVTAYSKDLHTFNFSTQKSQDNEFAKLCANKAGFIHHEKKFKSLSFPNWASLISNELNNIKIENLNRSVWSGDGGSVAVGGVYQDTNIEKFIKHKQFDNAATYFLDLMKYSVPTKFLKKQFHVDSTKTLVSSIASELKNFNGPSDKAFYCFLMQNDQKRHLDNHFETICDHEVELQLPFFDSEFIDAIFALPNSEIMFHRFYTEWFELFPKSIRETPWQTYPQHIACPIQTDQKLAYQWESKSKAPTIRDDIKVIVEVLKNQSVRQLFDIKKVTVALLLHLLRLKNYTYLIDHLKRI